MKKGEFQCFRCKERFKRIWIKDENKGLLRVLGGEMLIVEKPYPVLAKKKNRVSLCDDCNKIVISGQN